MEHFEIEESESQLKQNQKSIADNSFSARFYMVLAISAGMCFGTQNFLFQVAITKRPSHEKFDIRFFMPSVLGYLVSSSIFHIKEALNCYQEHKKCWTHHKSAYITTEQSVGLSMLRQRKRINWFNIFGVVARTTIHLVSFILHSSVLYYSIEANVNFSLIINLYSLTPFFTAVAFYCFFKEKLNKSHIIGMLFIFTCVYITSQSESVNSSN